MEVLGVKGLAWLVVLAALVEQRGGAANAQAVNLSSSHGTDLYIPLRKACPAGCEQRGNCNIETGRCECAWGYIGEPLMRTAHKAIDSMVLRVSMWSAASASLL